MYCLIGTSAVIMTPWTAETIVGRLERRGLERRQRNAVGLTTISILGVERKRGGSLINYDGRARVMSRADVRGCHGGFGADAVTNSPRVGCLNVMDFA